MIGDIRLGGLVQIDEPELAAQCTTSAPSTLFPSATWRPRLRGQKFPPLTIENTMDTQKMPALTCADLTIFIAIGDHLSFGEQRKMLRWERPALGKLRVVVESRLAVCEWQEFAATPDGERAFANKRKCPSGA
jgi:hypothetical protein